MSGVTKLSISLPTTVANTLKRQAAAQGIPLSQLVAETVKRETRAAAFRAALRNAYGPLSETDRVQGQRLLESARTPQQILSVSKQPSSGSK